MCIYKSFVVVFTRDRACDTSKEKKNERGDVLTKTTGKALLKSLVDADFRKNELMNKVEENPYFPATKEMAETIRRTKLLQCGDDPCKPKKNCDSCVPRAKLSGDLGAKIEHLELKKKMRVDEIKMLDRELSEKREEKRRFDQTKCSLEEEGNEPKRRKVSNDKFTIPKLSSSIDAIQEGRDDRGGNTGRAKNGRSESPADPDAKGIRDVCPGRIYSKPEEESGRPLRESASEGRNETSGWGNRGNHRGRGGFERGFHGHGYRGVRGGRGFHGNGRGRGQFRGNFRGNFRGGFQASFRGNRRGEMNGGKNIPFEEKKEAEKEIAVEKKSVKERLGNKDNYFPMEIIDEPKRTMSAKQLRFHQESRRSTRNEEEEEDDEAGHE